MMDGVSTMAKERAGCAFRDFKAAAACGLGTSFAASSINNLDHRIGKLPLYYAIISLPLSARYFDFLDFLSAVQQFTTNTPTRLLEPPLNHHPGHRAFTNLQCRNTSERYTSQSWGSRNVEE